MFYVFLDYVYSKLGIFGAVFGGVFCGLQSDPGVIVSISPIVLWLAKVFVSALIGALVARLVKWVFR